MSCMRNEGIHMLEWLAYHRVIGFGPVVICSNDCDDGSDRSPRPPRPARADRPPAEPLPPGEPPQKHGIARALAHLRTAPPTGSPTSTADEFLNVAPGAGPVQDLIARAQDAHVIALPWRLFGDNGHQTWPGETLRAFTACEAAPDPATVKFKSLFRHRAFASASDHMPTLPRIETPLAVNTAGRAALLRAALRSARRALPPHRRGPPGRNRRQPLRHPLNRQSSS
jgi:hypothetical protein